MRVVPGRPDLNVKFMIREIKRAKYKGVDIIVFPELCVSGYMIGDKWENNDFLADLMNYNDDIREATRGICAIWGNVYAEFKLRNEDGRVRKYNAAYVAQDGKWASGGVVGYYGVTFKTLLPEYRIFFDERHFHSLRQRAQDAGRDAAEFIQPFSVKIKERFVEVGVSICEDAWDTDYEISPNTILKKKGAEIIFNISCSPWTWKKDEKRHQVMGALARKLGIPLVYCNNVGSQNNGDNVCIFKGRSAIYNRDGAIGLLLPSCKEITRIVTISDVEISYPLPRAHSDDEELYEAVFYGIKQFFYGMHPRKVAIGLSGGIDSALVAALLVEALGKNRVLAINMPTRFNSILTIGLAETLARRLGIEMRTIPIEDSYQLKVKQLASVGITASSFDQENIQARERGAGILAAVAASEGGVYINTSNKVEAAFGYGTLYGDWNGAFAPIADLLKGEIYQLARYINKRAGKEVIPQEIIDLRPSAELSANQDVTQGKGDPFCYPYHDKLVRAFLEFRLGPTEILKMYFAGGVMEVEKKLFVPSGTITKNFPTSADFVRDLREKWRMFCAASFKRVQSPPILILSKRAFGQDYMEFISEADIYFPRQFLELEKVILRQKKNRRK